VPAVVYTHDSPSFTLTIQNPASGRGTDTAYNGTVHFVSTDSSFVIGDSSQIYSNGDYTFTAKDQGAHTFFLSQTTQGSQKLTATDTQNNAITSSVTYTVAKAPTTVALTLT
jgi:hypothetical protein